MELTHIRVSGNHRSFVAFQIAAVRSPHIPHRRLIAVDAADMQRIDPGDSG
jgi:hypothetical protein